MNKRIAKIMVAFLSVSLTVISAPAGIIAAGASHAFKICNNGTVWAWGNNDYGQLGDGTTMGQNRPVKITAM